MQRPYSDEQIKEIVETGTFTDEQFGKLFDYYCNTGEMPYGVAKARTGDPHHWIIEQLEREIA